MKYIIDVPSDLYAICKTLRVPVKVGNGDLSWYNTYIRAEPYTEPDREAVENEVWEFARRIICPSECCGDSISKYTEEFLGIPSHKTRAIFKDLSYQEAKAKYEAWKKSKDEIRVGDEVIYHGNKYVVGYVGAYEVYHIVDQNWIRVVVQGDYQIFKTGRHFPEVEELLKKMRDTDED